MKMQRHFKFQVVLNLWDKTDVLLRVIHSRTDILHKLTFLQNWKFVLKFSFDETQMSSQLEAK